MNAIEVGAAAVVGIALVWLVIQPLVLPGVAMPIDVDPPDPEETPRGQALLALKEIEFDRATGKLSEGDFQSLNARYTAAALATLDAPVVAGAPRCVTHGIRPEADAIFCGECGAVLLASDGSCVACRTTLPADAVFCPGCGHRVGN